MSDKPTLRDQIDHERTRFEREISTLIRERVVDLYFRTGLEATISAKMMFRERHIPDGNGGISCERMAVGVDVQMDLKI